MRVLKSSAIYLGSSLINKAIPFLLLPIFTKYLTPAEFGTLSIFQLMVTFFTALVGMAIHTNISKNYFIYSHERMAKLVGNIAFILLVSTSLFSFLAFLVTMFFDNLFSIPSYWVRLMPLLSFMLMINTINLTLFRNEGRVKTFGIYEICNTFINLSVSILMLLVYKFGWESQAIGLSMAYGVFFIISSIHLYRRKFIIFSINKLEIKSILLLSIPLIPHVLGGIVIAVSDRLFIEHMVSLEEVGIYSIGYMFGMVVMLFTDAFIKAWNPWFFQMLSDSTHEKKLEIVKYSYIYIVAVFVLAVSIAIMSEFILPYFVDEKFYRAKEFIIWIALGYAVQGVYKIFFPYLVHISKTSFLGFSTFIAAIINLLLNYLFIDTFGTIGAAYATIVSFMCSAILVFWYQSRNFYMPWSLSFSCENGSNKFK